MRLIIIDPAIKQVSSTSIKWLRADGYSALNAKIYCFLGTDCYDTIRVEQSHRIFLDDMGLYKPALPRWLWAGYAGQLAGTGVMLRDAGEETISATLPLSYVREKVLFL